MFLIALRDLQFRLRRFLISVVAVALVLGLTLLLSGVAASFDIEAAGTLDDMAAGTWITTDGATGPFFGAVPLTGAEVVGIVAEETGADAAGVAFAPFTLNEESGPEGVLLYGVEPGHVGSPIPDEGRSLEGPNEAVVDSGLRDVGETIDFGDRQVTVVGTLDSSTINGGAQNVFLPLDDLQDIAYNGAPVLTAVAVAADDVGAPPGLTAFDRTEAQADLTRPVEPAEATIGLISLLLWIVAGCIIGSVIYLSVIERSGDFAVFKAIGVSTWWVVGGLMLQAMVLSLLSSVVAIAIAWLLAPVMEVPVALPLGLVLLVPGTAVVVSVVASLVGVRRAVRVDPALAFG